jgi:hypothetical protein
MEDDLKKKEIENGRRPEFFGRHPQKKWKTTSKKMEYNLQIK